MQVTSSLNKVTVVAVWDQASSAEAERFCTQLHSPVCRFSLKYAARPQWRMRKASQQIKLSLPRLLLRVAPAETCVLKPLQSRTQTGALNSSRRSRKLSRGFNPMRPAIQQQKSEWPYRSMTFDEASGQPRQERALEANSSRCARPSSSFQHAFSASGGTRQNKSPMRRALQVPQGAA